MSVHIDTSLITTLPIVSILTFGGGPLTRFKVIVFLLAAGTIIFVAISWGIVQEWIRRTRGRTWPKVPAIIDVVSVAFIEDNTLHFPPKDLSYYKATLTYVYHNSEQQMGDYSRNFAKKEDAEAWANSYKGETVKVHVDPRDPTRSVLREEDL